MPSHIYRASVKQLRLLHHHTVSTLKSFLIGYYKRLHPKASSFLGLAYREPNSSQGLTINEKQNHITESSGNGKGKKVTVGSFLNFGNIRNGRAVDKSGGEKGKGKEEVSASVWGESRAEACVELERKLKEIVMEDEENMANIQEFLHYYSRLTSPFFIDLVDRFFADILG